MDRICSICLGDLDNEGTVCTECSRIDKIENESDWYDGTQPSAREVALDQKICWCCGKERRVEGDTLCQSCINIWAEEVEASAAYMEDYEDPYLSDIVEPSDFDTETQNRFKVITSQIRKFLGF